MRTPTKCSTSWPAKAPFDWEARTCRSDLVRWSSYSRDDARGHAEGPQSTVPAVDCVRNALHQVGDGDLSMLYSPSCRFVFGRRVRTEAPHRTRIRIRQRRASRPNSECAGDLGPRVLQADRAVEDEASGLNRGRRRSSRAARTGSARPASRRPAPARPWRRSRTSSEFGLRLGQSSPPAVLPGPRP